MYKNPNAHIENRIKDLIPRMTLEEKVAQLIQGDISGWMNMSDPLDNTLVHNRTGQSPFDSHELRLTFHRPNGDDEAQRWFYMGSVIYQYLILCVLTGPTAGYAATYEKLV